jgi:nucleotidyltransferase substrate binding protein (TIGR01987 family)
MVNKDVRWLQRFSNLKKAFLRLKEAVDTENLSELESEGLIQRFEYTYELSWKTLQDLLEAKGYLDIKGPTPVIQQAFQDGIISDGEAWMRLKKSRENTSHTYNKEIAKEIIDNIISSYFGLFENLILRLEHESKGSQQQELFH